LTAKSMIFDVFNSWLIELTKAFDI
jgi:hypothetical protein